MFQAGNDAAGLAAQAAPSPALAALQARLQQAFDPAGIFHPGRLLPLA